MLAYNHARERLVHRERLIPRCNDSQGESSNDREKCERRDRNLQSVFSPSSQRPRRRVQTLDPFDAGNRIRLPQRGNDRVQVRQIMHLNVEVKGLEATVAMYQLEVNDVGMLLAEDA